MPEVLTARSTWRRDSTQCQNLLRSVSSAAGGGDQSGISLQGIFRRSRSSDRAKGGSRYRGSDAARSAERAPAAAAAAAEHASSNYAVAALVRCTYLSQPLLKHVIRGKNRPVWGVAILSSRIYAVTYCASSIDVYDVTSYDQVGSITVDGLKDPWDMAACPQQRCLYVCDWRTKCVFAIRPGDYDDREAIRTHKWIQMEHRPRGLSLSPDGNSVVAVCADWRKETSPDCLRVYDVPAAPSAAAKRPRVSRKVRLAGLGSVWQAVQERSGGSEGYILCHGGRWDRLHRVCRIDAEGRVRAAYGGDAGCGRDQLNIPASICVDSLGQVLVADFSNSRVHLLGVDLVYQRRLLCHLDGVDKPRRLCLDEERGLLLIGQENGEVRVYHVTEPKPPPAFAHMT